MRKYIFQTGGEESGFFNQMADTFLGQEQARQQQSYQASQQMPQEEEDSFMKELSEYEDNVAPEEKDAEMLERFNAKIAALEDQLVYQSEELQNQMVAYAAMSSDDGYDYYSRLYDTNDDTVPFTIDAQMPTLGSPMFKSSGQQGTQNIGRRGLEIGNTISNMLGYTPTFTSVYRTPEQQQQLVKQGVGVNKSYHLTGDAVDMKPEDWNKLTKEQQGTIKSKYDVVYHNNHYHIEPK